jgi:CRISPR-associated endonuclease/helicase Cas3
VVTAAPVSTGRAREWLRAALGLSDGDTPFPWQEELLTRFVSGRIERSLDIPTGLGKTAVMAIWLVARACGGRLPKRLVYVVDRRAVVDQATEVAIGLRDLVEGKPELKERLGLEGESSLPISTLRGKYVDNREWLEDPTSPTIVVGTVDMIGSRLFFEGYGVSRKMRPYHSGLLGADTLVVLDEAHLVPPFEKLLERVAAGSAEFGPCEEALRDMVPCFKLLSLSATGRTVGSDSLGLTDKDLADPVVKKRLDAPKRLRVLPLDRETQLQDAFAREAWKLSENGARPARLIIFCDSREVAGKAKGAIEKLATGDKKAGTAPGAIESELFVGGRRVFEREQAKENLTKLGFIAGSKVERQRPAFLFATAAAEVGVDLDADHMVCDLVAWERIVQRLGRVNRRGDGDASVFAIVEPEPKNIDELLEKPESDRSKKEAKMVERVERARAVTRILERLLDTDGLKNASPGALRKLKQSAETEPELEKLLNAATTPAPLRPALTRALVDAWSMTSLEQHTGRPAIDPWLRGWIEDDPTQTAVVWRTHLPMRLGSAEATRKEVEAFFEAAPPHASGLLETETFRVVDWLAARAKTVAGPPAASDEEGSADKPRLGTDDMVGFVLSRDGDLRGTLRLRDLVGRDDELFKDKHKELRNALSGATLVVDARLAGLKDGLLDEKEGTPPRTADDGQQWLGEHVIRFRVRSTDAAEGLMANAAWRERLRLVTDVSEEGEPRRWLIVEKWRHDAATEEDRSAARPQLLDEHQSWAEDRARNVARRLQLSREYEEMLAAAARLHDEGKRARRWQRAFNAAPRGRRRDGKSPGSGCSTRSVGLDPPVPPCPHAQRVHVLRSARLPRMGAGRIRRQRRHGRRPLPPPERRSYPAAGPA